MGGWGESIFLIAMCNYHFIKVLAATPMFKYFFIKGLFLLGEWLYPSQKWFSTFQGPMRSHPVKENHVGSAVSEILQYRHTRILLLYFILDTSIFQGYKNSTTLTSLNQSIKISKHNNNQTNERTCSNLIEV